MGPDEKEVQPAVRLSPKARRRTGLLAIRVPESVAGLYFSQVFSRSSRWIFRVILQIEKCLTGAEAEEKRGAAESLAPTDPSSIR